MKPKVYHQGIAPDSGRKRWKITVPKRCPKCNVLVKTREFACPVCSHRLRCTKKASDQRIMFLGSFLSLLCLVFAVLFMMVLHWLTKAK